MVSREPYGFRANSARDNVHMNASFMKNQMHSELRDKMGDSLYVSNLWTMDRVFDIFIHPSTLPEIYHYLGITNSEAFLVELLPISFEKSAFKFPDAGGIGSMSDLALAGSSSSEASAKSDSSLPHSVFATSVIVEKDSMYGIVSESLSLDDFHITGGVAGSSDDDVDPPPFPWKVAVKEGHVVMSDLLRQQLEVHDCSRVRLMDVLDKWKIPATENINVSLYPVYPGKVSQVGVAVCICGTFIW